MASEEACLFMLNHIDAYGKIVNESNLRKRMTNLRSTV